MVNMDTLALFLRDASAREFRLGEWDCGLWLADWYVRATDQPDPAAHLRGAAYESCEIINRLRAVTASLALPRTKMPARGDIGLLRLGSLAVGAICTGRGWAVLGETGVSHVPAHGARVMAAWRVA